MLCQRSGEKIGTGCAIVIPSHATLSQLPSGQGCAPTPRQRLTAREKIPRPVHRFLMRKLAILTRSTAGASETNRVPYLCIAMQHPENAFHAFLGIQPGENMVFLLFERKDVKNLVIALAIFRRRA
ncbi:hypothetical protein JGE73_23625 [Salmonella enterica subsp. enterica serovar Goldcoast]|nr:hypothetical protein [Salmonella enterica subsp. enterica serovar Goldcoast]